MTERVSRADPDPLGPARAALVALHAATSPTDRAAHLTEIWTHVQTALQERLGDSTFAGQPLIRELRQRDLITLAQAHAVLQLQALSARATGGEELPADAASAAGAALDALDPPAPLAMASLSAASTASEAPLAPSPAPSAARALTTDRAPLASRRTIWLALVAGVLVALAALVRVGGMPRSYRDGVAAYTAGHREEARADFARAVREAPTLAMPHLYLARIARDEGDLSTAGTELKQAVELEPGNAVIHRELGGLFLARGEKFLSLQRPDLAGEDFEAARRSYVRSLRIEPRDTAAQGYLACTLTKLGRRDEAATWLNRAGAGSWSACVATDSAPPAVKP